MAEPTAIEEQERPAEAGRIEPQRAEPQWELAECTCPDWCERDHELD